MRVPSTAERSNQSILKEVNSEHALKGQMQNLKLRYFGHLLARADSPEKTLTLGRLKAKGKGAAEEEMVRKRHQLNGHEFEKTPGDTGGQRSLEDRSP